MNIQDLHSNTNHWGFVQGLYLAQNDCGVAMRLHAGMEYEPESRKLWKSLCKDQMVVDIGAHTGIYSLDAWKAGAKAVLSVEPYHLNYARLVMNLRHGGFDPKSSVYCAVSDEDKTEMLSVASQLDYCSTGGRIGTFSNALQYPVNVRRLDSLLKREHHSKVRVIKIDTEKHGVKVLKGMPKILAYRPDLILECTEPGMGEILKPLGYLFYRISESEGLSEVGDLIPDDPFTFDAPNRFATIRKL